MTQATRARGAIGETAAVEMLTALGYEIVERNFRTRYGELDVVAVDRDVLVFCEVKTRLGREAIARALEAVGPTKQLQLRKMASEWLALSTATRTRTRAIRFDAIAVSVTASGRVLAMKHVRGAF